MPRPLMLLPACALFAAGPAMAQSGDTRPSTAPGPTAPGPTAPGPTVPGPVPDMRPGETLSDQMQRHNGVIPPARDVDPDMHVPAPDAGTMHVIPPPDGKGAVQPK